MTELRLINMKIGNEEAKALAQALKRNATLQFLDLYDNQISDDGARALAEALKMNTVLRGLYLNSGQISDDGARALAEALKVTVHTTLWRLAQNYNQINDGGAVPLAEALKRNTTLRALYLKGTREISPSKAGANAIVAALISRDNSQLEVLEMRDYCGDAAATKFMRALVDQKFPNMRSIDLVPLTVNQHLSELRVPLEYEGKYNDDMLAFLRERWESGEQALAVTKIIVTGPGEVGKTCLVSRLV